MHVLHINSQKDVKNIDKYINNGDHVFILIYMEGCGPCNATRPEWTKLESALKTHYANNNDIVIIDVNKDYIGSLKSIGTIDGFPTMKYIANRGQLVESYENSSINKKDRSVDSFVNWVESKINQVISTTNNNSPENAYKRIVKLKSRRLKSKYHKRSKNIRKKNKSRRNRKV
jgi:thiol-disulfide isomerase/thioredoxin